MSQKVMANIMYAIIMTSAKITSSYTLAYQYTREQNSWNGADIMIEIYEKNIWKFEELSGIKLEQQGKLNIN